MYLVVQTSSFQTLKYPIGRGLGLGLGPVGMLGITPESIGVIVS